jgi:hypothetical protein
MIMLRLLIQGVMPAIDLDDQPVTERTEIHDVTVDGHLSPKLHSS